MKQASVLLPRRVFASHTLLMQRCVGPIDPEISNSMALGLEEESLTSESWPHRLCTLVSHVKSNRAVKTNSTAGDPPL